MLPDAVDAVDASPQGLYEVEDGKSCCSFDVIITRMTLEGESKEGYWKGREVRHGHGSPSAQDQALVKDVYMYKVYIRIGWECLFVSSIHLFIQRYLPRIPTYPAQVHNIKASIQQLYYY